jgi:hypothetical protein
MALFKISKGSKSNLPSNLTEGFCWYTYDDSKFYIDHKDANGALVRKALNAQDAETLGGASLDSILNSINSTVDKISTISLLASRWTAATNIYSQVVTVNGATANSKVDIYPTPDQLVELQAAGISLVAVNDDGVVTVYAINNKPTSDYNMQVTLTEINQGGVING